MENKSLEISPCPFCKSNKTSVKTRTKKYHGFYNYIVASVRCHVCHARGPAVGEQIQLGTYGEEQRGGISYEEEKMKLLNKAIEHWNRRA